MTRPARARMWAVVDDKGKIVSAWPSLTRALHQVGTVNGAREAVGMSGRFTMTAGFFYEDGVTVDVIERTGRRK